MKKMKKIKKMKKKEKLCIKLFMHSKKYYNEKKLNQALEKIDKSFKYFNKLDEKSKQKLNDRYEFMTVLRGFIFEKLGKLLYAQIDLRYIYNNTKNTKLKKALAVEVERIAEAIYPKRTLTKEEQKAMDELKEYLDGIEEQEGAKNE